MRYLVFLLLTLFTLPSMSVAGYRDEFEKEFLTKTWAGAQVEENLCISCHSSEKMKLEFRDITDSWQASWHGQNGISCEHCHGGDPKDAAMSMSRQRGFTGSPRFRDVPEFCGKCHVGILANFLESDHGKALRAGRKAPNCVTCHGSHGIRKANIEIINEQLCMRCHSYERAKIMKQAIFLTELKIDHLENNLQELQREGIFVEENAKSLFSTQAEFRTLFHTVDVTLVKDRTEEITAKLDQIDKNIQDTFRELSFRKNFSAFLMLTFSGMGIVIFLLTKKKND